MFTNVPLAACATVYTTRIKSTIGSHFELYNTEAPAFHSVHKLVSHITSDRESLLVIANEFSREGEETTLADY